MQTSSIVCCPLLGCIILVSSCSCSHRPVSSFPWPASSCHHPVIILCSQHVLSSSIGSYHPPSARIILPSSLHHPARPVLPVIIHRPASSCRHPVSLGRKKIASLILTLYQFPLLFVVFHWLGMILLLAIDFHWCSIMRFLYSRRFQLFFIDCFSLVFMFPLFWFASGFHWITDVQWCAHGMANLCRRKFFCGHPGIILPRLWQAWRKNLGGGIILASSCPSSELTPSSWHHPGSLRSKTEKSSIFMFCSPGRLIIVPD